MLLILQNGSHTDGGVYIVYCCSPHIKLSRESFYWQIQPVLGKEVNTRFPIICLVLELDVNIENFDFLVTTLNHWKKNPSEMW